MGFMALLALGACGDAMPGADADIIAAQTAHLASLPTPPDGYRHQTPGEALPGIVLSGIPEGEPGWDILISDAGCYFFRYEGTLYPASNSPDIFWNDPAAQPYCVGQE